MSPSTRRAWIEIRIYKNRRYPFKSPSTRRAWIEIATSLENGNVFAVALHPEGVDRNSQSDIETLFKN